VIGDERKEPCGTLSIGVFDASGVKDPGEGVERADKALYAAKRKRNSVVFVDPEKPAEIPFTSYEDYRQESRAAEQTARAREQGARAGDQSARPGEQGAAKGGKG
jgi:hypothetical protein